MGLVATPAATKWGPPLHSTSGAAGQGWAGARPAPAPAPAATAIRPDESWSVGQLLAEWDRQQQELVAERRAREVRSDAACKGTRCMSNLTGTSVP
jgi:hypothetical protein